MNRLCLFCLLAVVAVRSHAEMNYIGIARGAPERRVDLDTNDDLSLMSDAYYSDCLLWHMFSYDDSGGASRDWFDLTPHAHNLTSNATNNNPTFSSDNGGYFDFDGTDDWLSRGVDDADMSFGDGSSDDPFSAAFWAYPRALSGFRATINKDSRETGATKLEWLFAFSSEPRLTVFLYDNTPSAANIRKWTTNITTTDWQHIVFTYNGNSNTNGMNIYVNGSLDNDGGVQGAAYVAMENLAAPVRVGAVRAAGGGFQWYFDGKLDDIRIYGRELTAAEVTSIYNATSGDH